MRKIILTSVKITLGGIFLLLLFIYFFQEKLIFHPEKIAGDYQYNFEIPFREVFLDTKDKQTLNALYFNVFNPKGVLLYFHGNAGNLIRWGEIASGFTKFGYDVMVMDYRSYGKSTGTFNEALMFSDAQVCYEYLKQQFEEDRILIYGRSLGAAFAVRTASENSPKLVILEAPFYNLKDVADQVYFPIPDLLFRYRFLSNEFVQKVNCPITIFHGTNDKVISIVSGEKLFKEIPGTDKELVIIEGGNHHNLKDFTVYQTTIKQLLQ